VVPAHKPQECSADKAAGAGDYSEREELGEAAQALE